MLPDAEKKGRDVAEPTTALGGDRPERANPADRDANAADRGTDQPDRGADAADRTANQLDRTANQLDRGADAADRGANQPDQGTDQPDQGADAADRGTDAGAPHEQPAPAEHEQPTAAPAAEPTVRDAISAPDAKGRPRRVTRRFPLFTRDTARPEGGGRAASGASPAPARQWPMLAVLGVAALGLLVTALDLFRVGTLLIGAALLGGAALRWMLPGVGMLAVRSRFTDIVTYGLLGGAIVLLAMMAQPHPWLEIPFLKDTLHFTLSN